MIDESEKLLNILNAKYINLLEIMKIEKDIKKLKEIEKDLNKINSVSKVLREFINYNTMKKIKSKS